MKINRYLAMTLCGGAFVLVTHAEKVRFEELPLELKDKIRVQVGGARIDDIDRETRDGKTVYEVAFKQNGRNTELVFDDKGQLQNGTSGALDAGKVAFNELPPIVQRAIEARLRGTTPNDIDRRVNNGEVSYEVGFKRGPQQEQQEILFSQDGRILRDVKISNRSIAAAGATEAITNFTTNPIQLSSRQKVSFETVPAAVKQAVSIASKGARIEDVERGQWRARTIYEFAFKDQGQHVELQVEENGRVFYDPRVAKSTASGVPAAAATGAGASSLYPDVTSAVPLSSGVKVDRRSVPAPVERAIHTHAAGAQVEDVERGTWRGMNVYEIAFKDGGRHVELQIDEKGNVVFDPRKK